MNALVQQEQRAIAQTQPAGRMAVADIISHVSTVQEVMRAVMKPDVHYGKIPGAGDKPTLLKAGAEVLCMVFRIADSYEVTDMSTADCIRYRVNCIGTHQTSGIVMGSGLGEASSNEEKYKWRKAVCDEEWDETPPNMRRVKHARGKGGTFYKAKQVRTEPADIANTVLKMANKRAKMAMVLNVTAASDCFAQDLEDMDEALRDHLARHGDEAPQAEQPAAAKAAAPAWPDEALDARKAKVPEWQKAGKTADEVIAFLASKGTLSDEQKARVRGWFAPAQQAQDVEPKVTYAQVHQQMQDARTPAKLNEAASLIAAVQDATQREELKTAYQGFRDSMNDSERP